MAYAGTTTIRGNTGYSTSTGFRSPYSAPSAPVTTRSPAVVTQSPSFATRSPVTAGVTRPSFPVSQPMTTARSVVQSPAQYAAPATIATTAVAPATTAVAPVTTAVAPATTAVARPAFTAPESARQRLAPKQVIQQATAALVTVPTPQAMVVAAPVDPIEVEEQQIEEKEKRLVTMKQQGAIKDKLIALQEARRNLRQFELDTAQDIPDAKTLKKLHKEEKKEEKKEKKEEKKEKKEDKKDKEGDQEAKMAEMQKQMAELHKLLTGKEGGNKDKPKEEPKKTEPKKEPKKEAPKGGPLIKSFSNPAPAPAPKKPAAEKPKPKKEETESESEGSDHGGKGCFGR